WLGPRPGPACPTAEPVGSSQWIPVGRVRSRSHHLQLLAASGALSTRYETHYFLHNLPIPPASRAHAGEGATGSGACSATIKGARSRAKVAFRHAQCAAKT